MSSPTVAIYPTSAGAVIPCPLCGETHNQLAISETGIERRFDMPVLPVRDYFQASCRNCGMLYINAPVDQSYLDELYGNETVEWAEELFGDPEARMNADERARFAEVVDLVAGHHQVRNVEWLDFGCQTGELGEDAIRKHAVVMSGVEISDDYAERAARLWKRDRSAVQPSLRGHNGAKFDVITSLETLEHMAAPWDMVAVFRAHLKADGVLTVSVPSSHYFRLKYHLFRLIRGVTSQQAIRERANNSRPSLFGLCHTHLYNFTPKSLSLLLTQQGFDVQHVGGIGWLSRFWLFSKLARVIEVLTFGRIAIFPSVIAVARKRGD